MTLTTYHLWYQVQIHRKMKILLILLSVDVAIGDKLSFGYLPPPGASLAGGDFNHNDLPFDLPKEIFQSMKSKYLDNQSETDSGEQITENKNYVNSEGIITPLSYQESFYTPSATISYTQTTTIFPILEYSSSSPSETSTNFNYNINETKNLDMDSVNNQFQDEYSTKSIEVTTNDPYYEIQNSSSDQSKGSINFSETEGSMRISGDMSKYNSTKSLKDNENRPNKSASFSVDEGIKNILEIYNSTDTSTQLPKNVESSSSHPVRKQSQYNSAVITNIQNNKLTPKGFSYSFDTSNGMHSDVSGSAQEGVKVKGAYSYVGDDGKLYKMEYTADENGFQPRGDHLPTSPPIPKEIQNVIEQAYKDKTAGIFDDGSYSEEKYGYKKYMPQSKNIVDMSHSVTYGNTLKAGNEMEDRQLSPSVFNENVNKMRKNLKTIGTKNKNKISKDSLNGANVIIDNHISTIHDLKKGYEYFSPQNSFELFENNALLPEFNTNENFYNTKSTNLTEVSRIDNEKSFEDVKKLRSQEIITKDNNEYIGLPENKTVENNFKKSSTFSEVDYNTYNREADIKEASDYFKSTLSVFSPINYVDTQEVNKKPEDLTTAGPKYYSVLEEYTRIPNLLEYETVQDTSDMNLSDQYFDIMQNSQTESSTSETRIGEEFNGPKQNPRYDANFGYFH